MDRRHLLSKDCRHSSLVILSLTWVLDSIKISARPFNLNSMGKLRVCTMLLLKFYLLLLAHNYIAADEMWLPISILQ